MAHCPPLYRQVPDVHVCFCPAGFVSFLGGGGGGGVPDSVFDFAFFGFWKPAQGEASIHGFFCILYSTLRGYTMQIRMLDIPAICLRTPENT